MPALRRATKFYFAATGVTGADPSLPLVPTNPRRVALLLQNTGSNLGLLRFGSPNQGGGADLMFAAGEKFSWHTSDTCPLEAVYLSSATPTTWTVIETVDPSLPL